MSRMAQRSSRATQTFEDHEFIDDYDEPSKSGRSPSGQRNRLLKEIGGRWYWIALGAVLGVLAGGYYLSKAPKQYTAVSTLLVKHQVVSMMASEGQVESIDPRSVEAVNTIVERIRRVDLLERVASRGEVRDAPGLIPPRIDWLPAWLSSQIERRPPATEELEVPTPAELAGSISSWIKVSVRRGTRLVDVSVTHPVPEVSKVLADAVVNEFLEESATSRSDKRDSSISLLEKESDGARSRLEAARGALATYARTLEVLKELDEKETAVNTLKLRYLPKHPKMIAAEGEFAAKKHRFIEEFELARQAVSDRSYWESQKDELAGGAKASDDYFRVARQQLLARSSVLGSEIESATAVFNSMLTRKEEAGVDRQTDQSSAEINNLARVPTWSSSPAARKAYGTGGVGGAAFGLAIALLLVRLDDRYHTVAQITAETGETVLAAISQIKESHLDAAAKKAPPVPPDQYEKLQDNWDSHLIFRPETSRSVYAEMYRVLRASVSLLGDETARKITLFTSAIPGEGKTATSANFALAAAAQGRKTLLIDFDLRKPSVHEMFGLGRGIRPGITECLANQCAFDEIIHHETGQENLHLVLSGTRAPNPGELLDAGRIRNILARACRDYDVVVLDTAPLLAVPDTRILAPLVHNVCLVVRADHTPKGAVQRVLDVLHDDATSICGIVFNGFQEKRRRIGDNYSYGYYGSSGSYGAYGVYGQEDEPKRSRKKRKQRR